MSAEFDWLDGAEAPAAKNPEKFENSNIVVDYKDGHMFIRNKVPYTPNKKRRPRKKGELAKEDAVATSVAQCSRMLTSRQREYLRALVQYKWDANLAMKAMRKTGTPITTSCVNRWRERDQYFIRVYEKAKADARLSVVDKDTLLLHADKIRQDALRPKPILFKGQETGFYENKPDTALRALELLMKTQKMLGNDQETQTQGTGPPLVIQIVQGEKVIDVTNGVTIDLPGPHDAS